MTAKWNKEVVIRNGKHRTSRYKRDLYEMGFRHVPSAGGSPWVLHEILSDSEAEELRRYCKRRKLKITITDRNLTRSQTYRKNYTEEHTRYRCAYCGKKLREDNLTVDHIVPVKAVKGNRSNIWFRMLNITDINDEKNLAPACKKCNQKKGSREGLWVLRGLIGKNYTVRTVMNIVRTVAIIAIIIVLIAICYRTYLNPSWIWDIVPKPSLM